MTETSAWTVDDPSAAWPARLHGSRVEPEFDPAGPAFPGPPGTRLPEATTADLDTLTGADPLGLHLVAVAATRLVLAALTGDTRPVVVAPVPLGHPHDGELAWCAPLPLDDLDDRIEDVLRATHDEFEAALPLAWPDRQLLADRLARSEAADPRVLSRLAVVHGGAHRCGPLGETDLVITLERDDGGIIVGLRSPLERVPRAAWSLPRCVAATMAWIAANPHERAADVDVLGAEQRAELTRWASRAQAEKPGGEFEGTVSLTLPTGLPAPIGMPGTLRALGSPECPALWTPTGELVVLAAPTQNIDTLPQEADPSVRWAPIDDAERAVDEAWSHVLGTPPRSAREDFFHAGGHSFTAALLVARLAETSGSTVAVRDVFTARTAAEIAALLRTADSARAAAPTPATAGPTAASNAQRRLWFLEGYDGSELRPYNMVEAYRLDVRPTEQLLTAALTAVVARHEALRTALRLDGEGLEQVVLGVEQAPPNLLVQRVRTEDLKAVLAEAAAAEQRHRFDLASGRLLRATWLDDGSDSATLLLNIHHCAGDGWSSAVVMDDLVAALRDGTLPAEPPMPYREHCAWLAQWLASDGGEGDRAFWRRTLAGLDPADLPLDRRRPPVRDSRGGKAQLPLDLPAEALTRLCREADVTPFMVFVAAVRVLLHRLTGQGDVPLGTVVAGRDQPGSITSVGLFANTVVLRTAIDGDMDFRAVLREVRYTAQLTREHDRYPFDALVDELGVERVPGRNPLFDLFVETVLTGPPAFHAADHVARVETELLVSDFDLAFSFTDDAVWVRYRADVVDPETAGRLAQQVRELLSGLLADPDAPVSMAPLLPADQRRYLLDAVNDTVAPFPADATLLDLVDRQTVARPDAPAVVHGDTTLSFVELDRRAERLAASLAERAAAGPGRLVAIVCKRTEWMVVALLAVLKTGAAFLPLDPEQPDARLGRLLSRSAAVAVVADGRYLETCERLATVPVLDARDERPASPRPPGAAAGPADLAYVIYTSGSTGEPKGVMVEHRGIVNTVHFRAGYYGFDAGHCVLQVPPIHFDSGINDVFSALIAGTPVVVISRQDVLDPATVAATIERYRVTHVMLVPSLYQILLDRLAPALGSVRQIVLVGERLPETLARQHAELVGQARLYNEYGPTEDSVWTTVEEITDPGAEILIGRPIANKVVDLLDPDGRLVPLGVAGEICIGGIGLARGYLDDPALTERRFVPNPERPGRRMYRTGDLAQRLPDGRLRYLGRIDDQVKIRGQRVEPGEVAAVLCDAPGVRACAVVPLPDAHGAPRLVAYVVGEAAPAGLREFAGRRLPPAMVPERFVALDELPVTSNGKIDRRRLPAPESIPETPSASEAPSALAAPLDDAERLVRDVWESVLGQPVADLDASLFLLGGHSLAAARIAVELTTRCGAPVSVGSVFRHQTVRSLAACVRELEPAPAPALPVALPLAPPPLSAGTPLSHAQRRIWLAAQADPGAFVICDVLPLGRRLDSDALRHALRHGIERHEALRTRFEASGATATQHVLDQLPDVPLVVAELPAGTTGDSTALREALAEVREIRFDPSRAPLIEVRLIRGLPDGDLLAVSAHHLVYDGSSVAILLDELLAAHDAYATGAEPSVAGPAPRYRDWVAAEQAWLAGDQAQRAEEFWRRTLADPPTPTEILPGPRSLRRGTQVVLRRTTPHHRTDRGTPFALAVAALATAVHRRTGALDMIIGCPMSLRDGADADGAIGCFVNAVPLRVDLAPDMSLGGVLDRVTERVLAAAEHVRLPFDALIRRLRIRSTPGRSLLFDLGVSWEERGAVDQADDAVTLPPPTVGAAADLWVYVHESPTALVLEIAYDTALAEPAHAAEIADEIADLVTLIAREPESPLAGPRLALAGSQTSHTEGVL
jgi:amino acid adenylation domain-containing protein